MINFVSRFKRICDIMVRKAGKRDIQAIIGLLHQVDMVHHVIRPDLFKPNTTKYNEQELETLLGESLAVLGGSIGAWLGMKIWHHKTLHKKFRYGVPAITIIQLSLIGYLLYK